MSLIPLLFEEPERFFTSRSYDQSIPFIHPRTQHFLRPWRSAISQSNTGSKVDGGKDRFEVHLDVHHFSPEEISVTAVDEFIVVEAKHEEKQDEQGYITRHFVRKYQLPQGHQIENIQSKLSSDGILKIISHKNRFGLKERIIPVQLVGPIKTDLLTKMRNKDLKRTNENNTETIETEEPKAKIPKQ